MSNYNLKGKGTMRKLFTCLSLFALLTVFTVGQAAAFTIGNFVDDTAKGVFIVEGLQVNGTFGVASSNATSIAGFNASVTLASNSSVIDQYGNFTSTGGFFTQGGNSTELFQIDQSGGWTEFMVNGSSYGNVEIDVFAKFEAENGQGDLTSQYYGFSTSDNKIIFGGLTGDGFFPYPNPENSNATAMLTLVNKGSLTPATSLTAVQSGTWSFFTLIANGTLNGGQQLGGVDDSPYSARVGNLTVSSSNVATVKFFDYESLSGAFEGTLTASADIDGITVQNASATNNLSNISYAGNWTVMANATMDTAQEVIASNSRIGSPDLGTLDETGYANGTQFTVALKNAELVDADADLQGTWKISTLGGQFINSKTDMLLGNIYVDSTKKITNGGIFRISKTALTNTAYTGDASGSITWADITLNTETFTNLVIKDSASALVLNATGRLLNSSTKKLFTGLLFDADNGRPSGIVFMSGTASGAPKATIDAEENNLTNLGFDVGVGANATLLGADYWNISNPVTSDFFGFTGTPGADVRVLVTFNATIDDPTGLTVGGSSVNLFKVDNATANRAAVQSFTYSTTLTDDVKANSNASLTDSDVGTWCLFDPAAAAQFCEATGSALEAGKVYTVAYVVKEGSSWDLYSGDAGKLVDPVFIAGSAGSSSSSSSDSGCVLNPAAGFGLEWLLLLAAPLLAVLRNRFRK